MSTPMSLSSSYATPVTEDPALAFLLRREYIMFGFFAFIASLVYGAMGVCDTHGTASLLGAAVLIIIGVQLSRSRPTLKLWRVFVVSGTVLLCLASACIVDSAVYHRTPVSASPTAAAAIATGAPVHNHTTTTTAAPTPTPTAASVRRA